LVLDFAKITRDHVVEACRQILTEGVPPRHAARSTFLWFEGQRLPAKYVLGRAWKIESGNPINYEDFTGGKSSASVLDALGFEIDYSRGPKHLSRQRRRLASNAEPSSPMPASPVTQEGERADRTTKEALCGELKKRCGRVLHEIESTVKSVWATVVSSQQGSSERKSPRVVTVCIRGNSISEVEKNAERTEHFVQIIKAIASKDWRTDAIVFPGGFFYLPEDVACLDYNSRVGKFKDEPFSSECAKSAAACGALLVAGVDCRDQELCVAWNRDGILGIGCKVLPAPGQEKQMKVDCQDFESTDRLVPMRCGCALLCACYDVYGCKPDKENTARNLLYHGRRVGADESGDVLRQSRERLNRMVRQATMALAAVHFFSDRGESSGKGYFQRLGIAEPSKYLGGQLVFGAAHFETLPDHERVTLAGKRGDTLEAAEHFYLDKNGDECASRRMAFALARLFVSE
jgi:hypothetical protein